MKKFLALAALLVSAAAVHAGFTINGIKYNGLNKNGIKYNGLNKNGIKYNGLNKNGIKYNGFNINGTSQTGTEPGLHITGIILADDSE